MNNSGSGLLLAILAVIVILIVGAALLFMPQAAGPGAGTPGRASVTVSASLVRNPNGLSAVITVTNPGSGDLRNFQITRLVVSGMSGGPTMPHTLGTVRGGGSVSVTIPFSGPAPAPNAWVPVNFDYTYKTGWFGQGAGSSGVTSIVP
ncbi:MAG TPA: hypothetical protein VNM14_01605 [Planctomycetota bacterium]|jgi:hypothetical protein|nr:hypothetical protein [Planctomycetota bacterium]